MTIRFSKQTQSFYPDDLTYPNEPLDLVEVTDAEHQIAINRNADETLDYVNNTLIIVSAPALTPQQAQTAQIASLTSSYQAAIYADIQYTSAGGVDQTFQSDAESVNILSQQLNVYVTAGTPLPSGYSWVAKDNSQVPFTVADLKGLASVIGTRGAAAFSHLQTQKAAVRAATTAAAVQAITF